MVALQDKARGALLGLAVGDALGFPVEGLSRKRARRRYSGIDRYRFLGSTGFVSDDTEQAIITAEAILESQGVPEKAAQIFGRKLRGWFWTLPPGLGASTLKACLRLTLGMKSGVASAGNGAAMRMAPVGLFTEQPEELTRVLARVTHTDPRGVDGGVAVAFAVSRLIRGQDCHFTHLPELDERLSKALKQAWEMCEAGQEFDTIAESLGTTGYVLHTVPLAFAALWSRPQTFLEGLQKVILQGGDADTNGAVAGALLGARFGAADIPESLLNALEPSHGRTRLERLADQLVAGSGEVQRPGFLALRFRECAIKVGVAAHVLGRMIPY